MEGVGRVAETARVVEYEGDFGEMRRSDERGCARGDDGESVRVAGNGARGPCERGGATRGDEEGISEVGGETAELETLRRGRS